MPARALRSPTLKIRAHVVRGESVFLHNNMGEELPILKGILNGVVNYHNARTLTYNYLFIYLSIDILFMPLLIIINISKTYYLLCWLIFISYPKNEQKKIKFVRIYLVVV